MQGSPSWQGSTFFKGNTMPGFVVFFFFKESKNNRLSLILIQHWKQSWYMCLVCLFGKFDTESPRSRCPALPWPSYCVNTHTGDLSSPQPSSDSCPSLLLKTWPSVRWRWRGITLGLNQVIFEEPQWLAGGVVLLIYGRCKSAFFFFCCKRISPCVISTCGNSMQNCVSEICATSTSLERWFQVSSPHQNLFLECS